MTQPFIEPASTCKWSLEQFQATMSRCPFNRWLGLKALVVGIDGVEILLPWREELLSSPEAQSMHGGILASVVDTGSAYAIAAQIGRGVPTVDLRIDYHKVAKPGEYIVKGRAIQIGRSVASGEAHVYDTQGLLIASGRGVFFTGGASR